MIDLVGRRRWFFLLSALLTVPGLLFLLLGGLRPGIDFTGGTAWELRFAAPVNATAVRAVFVEAGREALVQTAADGVVLVRTGPLAAGSAEKAALADALAARLGPFTELQLQTVGPTVGTAIARRAVAAVGFAALGILLYLAYAFRGAAHPFRYGACAVAAMLHDVLVVLGAFAILGRVRGVEIDALFVTALLTVIGFSVHDTIVVFDRIRENTGAMPGESYAAIVNRSLVQTLARSINTSFTVLLTLLALFLLGGATLATFVLALLIGVASGTYSSIFNASLLLVVWEERARAVPAVPRDVRLA